MSSRYDNYRVLINENPHYKELLDKRGVNFIRQYETPRMGAITVEETINLTSMEHIWSSGDRLYKLAYKAYGDSKYWWIIAWYNKAPTEAHLKLGDLIYIPIPLERVLSYYGT